MEPVTLSREDGARLQVSALRQENTLLVSYSFHNGAKRSAFLFNRLFTEVSPMRVFETGADLAYLAIEGDKVVVGKRIDPVPPRMAVEIRVVPCLTRVPAGGRFEETFRLALPLKPFSAYLDPPKGHQAAVDRELIFELGYFLAVPEREHLIRKVKTLQGEGHRVEPFPITSQQLFRATLPLKVPSQQGQ